MELQIPDVATVAVPLPAQGHLNQLLHLSRRISAHGFPVYFLSSSTHVRQAKSRAYNSCSAAAGAANIHFHEFPTIPFQNPRPDPSAANKFPSQLVPALHASTLLRRPIFEFVESLSRDFRKVVVIYDVLMAYVVQDIGSIPNAEAYGFQSISAFTVCTWEVGTLPPESPPAAEVLKEVPSMDGYYSDEFGDYLKLQIGAKKISSDVIYNSNTVIEGLYLDLLGKVTNAGKIWGLGPFHSLPPVINNFEKRDKCLAWLDKQAAPNSVIYVSFGTTSCFSDEQIREIAVGLERSGHKFIWVLREADRGDIFSGEDRRASLPDGFEDRIGERGLVVRDWVPQLEILRHRSTGGFLSHCGWNSCLESISMGVPMATWPLHSDQPGNAVLITKVLRVGIEVKAWSREDELVTSDTVERAVRELMDGGDEVRGRAAELGEAVRDTVVAGKEMELFVRHISTHG